MVMTGTTALMNTQQNAAMMGGGMVMNPMMGDMGAMPMPLAMMPPMGMPQMNPEMVQGHFPPMPMVQQTMPPEPAEMVPPIPQQEPVAQAQSVMREQAPSDYQVCDWLQVRRLDSHLLEIL
jgi:hypothetical protein